MGHPIVLPDRLQDHTQHVMWQRCQQCAVILSVNSDVDPRPNWRL